MEEKEFTMNNASAVWWFTAWRSFIVLLVLYAIFWVAEGWTGTAEPYATIYDTIEWLVLVLAQIFFIKLAVNRDFKGKHTGSFRLSAHSLTGVDSSPRPENNTFAPQSVGENLSEVPPAT